MAPLAPKVEYVLPHAYSRNQCQLTTFFGSMGQDTVTIYVGPHRQGFVVRKDLLCKASNSSKVHFVQIQRCQSIFLGHA
jgi:hypothetical protein